MAAAVEELLAQTGWVPEPLRTPGQTFTPVAETNAPDVDADGSAQAAEDTTEGPPRAVAAE